MERINCGIVFYSETEGKEEKDGGTEVWEKRSEETFERKWKEIKLKRKTWKIRKKIIENEKELVQV